MQAIDKAWGGGQEYKNAYEDQTVGMALTAINNEFYKDSEYKFVKKYENVKAICKNSYIQSAVRTSNISDIRLFCIKKKMVLVLCIMAIVLNKKHGR